MEAMDNDSKYAGTAVADLAAKKASSYRRHTSNADFGASAGDPDAVRKVWREAWFPKNKAWLPREWKLKNDRRGGYLCWFCSGRRATSPQRTSAGRPPARKPNAVT